MSIVRMCPYDKDEHCKYERYFGEPMFSKCENCEIKIGAVIKQRKMKEEHRIDCCGKWVSYKDYIKELEQKLETERSSRIALVNKIAELEAQIEKMKCCENCKHYTTFNNACMEYGYFLDRCDKTKWEIKEK